MQNLLTEIPGGLDAFHLRWALGTTGNMAVSRQRVVDAGMFDESFTGWGLEDTDLSIRLFQAGARFVISSAAVNYHQVHARPPTWEKEWFRNFLHLWAKHDSVQLPLYYFAFTGKMTARQINAIADDCERLEREGRSALVQELKRLYRLAVPGAL